MPAGSEAVLVGVCETPSTFVHWSRDSTAFIGATVDQHMWGGTPYSCGEPVEGYSAICNTLNTATQWSAADRARTILEENFDGSYIIAGTELAPEIAGG